MSLRSITLTVAASLALACTSSTSETPGKADAKKADAKGGKKEGELSEKAKAHATPVGEKEKPQPAGDPAKDAEAKAFVTETDKQLRTLWVEGAKAEWAKATNITDETEAAAAKANAATMAYETKAIRESTKFSDYKGDADVERQVKLLQLTSTLPAPDDEAKRNELSGIMAKLEGMYGKGKYCKGRGAKEVCRDLGQLEDVLANPKSKYNEQLDAWQGWHEVAKPMRPLYSRFVELGNEGAKGIGYDDMGILWRSRYDMAPDAFEQEVERLWKQVEPLYTALHCHVRAKLHDKYGDDVPAEGPIPAHLLGNMWAQDWQNLYPMLEPFPDEPSLDVTEALKKASYDEIKMVKTAEGFFTSLGLDPLPATFWERSMFTKPAGKDVVCHASAWDVEMNNDLRIKMCIKINHEDLVTIHHELGHDYYYMNYYTKPALYQSGANDGFHEAIGDAIALSITPEYLKKIGLLTEISDNDKGIINKQMQDALGKIAFLPFGKLIDQWRWDVFSGKTTPDRYNAAWWDLKLKYQGVAPATSRGEEFFDPGAKYHIPGNTPYARYFLAHILQFQFHKSMCAAAGHTGPLHTCSIYGSKEAGAKLKAMLEMGASKPWPDALEALTGSREMDAGALMEYFAPLMKHLEEQNKARKCGW
ncbi:MAG TPA: M2 family metallopeptidase [Nannocystaceae bacterium]|nr:M2 family metallopeptidase [Nannocystaceae bacterium]